MKILMVVFGFLLYFSSATIFDTSMTHFGLNNHFQYGTSSYQKGTRN
jgi:hypothetical protein